ncbi:AMP-binding protein [Ruminiclostridium cellobioparum]
MIIGIYGIIKAGGAYVPMDLAIREKESKYMLKDCKLK